MDNSAEKGLSLREVRRLTQRSVNLSAEVEASVSAILKNVQENGDRALRELTEKFDESDWIVSA